MHKIERHSGTLGHSRLEIKGFKTSEAMHRFLNQGMNGNQWCESKRDLKPGVYALAGGRWVSVKSVDPFLLAHI